ncbi:MAG: NAD(P)H-binding protein [Elusimicrobiales bacterium]|nr:NAD(P)H-binding protein [Elusimicrobiales bacterium]
MKICVFGCSGFLGKEFVNFVGDKYFLILPSRKNKEEKREDNKIYSPFDIEKNISEHKPDMIVNFIGILKETRYENYNEAHVNNVIRMTDAAIKNKVTKIIHISAYGVYKGCNSGYFKTKEKAEEIIKNSGLEYLIIRPSVVLGYGQKLIGDLAKISRFSPVILAPTGKVAPIDVKEVINVVMRGIDGESGVVEVFGNVLSYLDLFKMLLDRIGVKRIVVEVPNFLFLPLVITGFFMKDPLMTYDLYKMMSCDNIYDKK